MGNYDAEIRVSTKVETSQMQKLQIQIDKAVDKVDALQKKYDELKNKKIPTQGYTDLENKIKSAKYVLDSLIDEQKKLSEKGIGKGLDGEITRAYKAVQQLKAELARAIENRDQDYYLVIEDSLNRAKAHLQELMAKEPRPLGDLIYYDNIESKVRSIKEEIAPIEAEMQKLVDTGKAFTIGADGAEINKAANDLARAKSELRALVTKQEELGAKSVKVSDGLKRIGSASHSAFRTITRGANQAFSSVSRGARQSNGALSSFLGRLKGLAASAFIFNLLSKGFNAMVSSMKTGFTNLMGYSNSFANSIQSVKNSLSTLGNQIAAAFAPIVQAVIPWLNQLISMITTAMSYVSQFIAALTGRSTYIRAKKVQDSFNSSLGDTSSKADDAADSMDDMADSTKKARGALAEFDHLDVLEKQDDSADKIKDLDDALKDLGSGAGGGVGDLFEEVPIEDSILDAVGKLKEILEKLFAPLKEAWEREGEFVMKAWKYALDEIWQLVKDIGRDFLTMWNQEATIRMLADILHIFGDIGLIIGNIAHALDEAWNKNQTGLHILENIRDIFAVIVHNIREAADFTVLWSKTLDFSPLLESIEHLTSAFVPFADFVSGTLADFYTQFLLPLASWTISENGLPRLVNILGDFMDAVDWESLRTSLKNLYIALEPYAEAIAEGLIDFIEKLKGFGIDFLNSLPISIQALANALENGNPDKVREWASAILEFIAAIEALKLAFKGVEKIGEIAAVAKVGIEGLFTLFQTMNPGMLGEIGIKLGDLLTGSFLDPREWDNWIGDLANEIYNFLMDGASRLEEFVNTTFGIDNTLAWFDEAYENFKQGGIHILEGILDGFMGALILIPEVIVNFFEACWNELCNIFGIASPAQEMKPIGEYILRGIAEGFIAAFTYFMDALASFWETCIVPWFSPEKWLELGENIKLALIEKWTEIQEWFAEFWAIFTETLFEIWENIILFFTETWENITLIFQTFIDFINDTVIPIWQESWSTAQNIFQLFHDFLTKIINTVKTLFTEFFQKFVKNIIDVNWKNAWETAQNIFEAFKGKVSSVIDAIRGIIQSFFDWVLGIIQEILGAIESIGSAVAGVFSVGGSFGGGGGGTSFSMARAASFDFDDYPHLASGAVIRGGNPYMAVLGDQPRGQTNVETPAELIKDMVAQGISESGIGNMSGNINADMTLDGESFARLFVPYVIDEMRRQGLDVEVLGVT